MKKRSASSRSDARGARSAHATKSGQQTISAERLDRLFDSGSEAIDQHLDWSTARRPGRDVQRVNVDFPIALLRQIDAEADRIGVTRQAFIKLRMADAMVRLTGPVRVVEEVKDVKRPHNWPIVSNKNRTKKKRAVALTAEQKSDRSSS